jgi:hypothetical protein
MYFGGDKFCNAAPNSKTCLTTLEDRNICSAPAVTKTVSTSGLSFLFFRPAGIHPSKSDTA